MRCQSPLSTASVSSPLSWYSVAHKLNLCLGNLASVYGSYIWPKQDGPQYKAGFGATTGLILAGGAVTMFGESRFAVNSRRFVGYLICDMPFF